MEFMALQTEDFDFLAFLLLMGPLEEGLADELKQRVDKIAEASPEKNALALDVRGISEVTTNAVKEFKLIRDIVNEKGWDFYLCNIPRLLQPKILRNEKNRDELNVFASRENLFSHLEEIESSKISVTPDPLPVIVRTPEGVRLLQGQAVDLSGDYLYVQTTDKNALAFKMKRKQPAEISFETNKFQIPPREALILDSKTKEEGKGFLLTVELTELLEQDLELLNNYFSPR